ICPNCNEGNTQDAKFCSKCKMIMSFEGYQEALESQKEKEDELKAMKDQFNTMQFQMQSVISALSSMDQSTKNTFAKQLFANGVYKNEESPAKKKVFTYQQETGS
ncbi:MAG: zinc ribbon domain-containing protein, partial [Candidatus Nitrosopolaris sp.]